MAWRIEISKKALKEASRLERAGLKARTQELIDKIKIDPYAPGDNFEKLVGDLSGLYSRRIDYSNRIVYAILKESKTVRILRFAGHY